MRVSSPKAIITLLRSTLRRLEAAPELDPSEPMLLEFKRSIRHSILKLEAQNAKAA